MISRSLNLLLAAAFFGAASAESPRRLLSSNDAGMLLARGLGQRRLQYQDLPDICQSFELLIDEIPNGRDSCDCDGTSVNCLFKAVCPEGQEDDPHCADTVMYRVAFEDEEVSVTSCAAISEGGFEETCARVSLAPDLQLDKCEEGTYGGRPCDCEVCDNRASLLLDCSVYDARAKTSCAPIGLGEIKPLAHGFNTTAPPPEEMESLDGPDDIDEIEEGASSALQNTVALAIVSVVATVATLF
ncbi:expressed unknown protein [Seminavis robusta]|uniref:Uncharacterized protein n=1 Tax=Seminavis robusta TaxID=568900 RepID=A0A9N8EZ73_9STRA|nr:expressed unknown protein [Seminavis robusta]|eukprot:Sro2381_g325520.1 n/a (243) ;mRNA; f:9417-10145